MEPEIYSQQNLTSFLHPQNSHTWLPEINGKFYNIVTHLGLFRLASCLLSGTPFYSECLAFIATPSLQYLMLPNQTAENGQVVFSQEKAQKWCQLSKRKELSIKEAEKAAKHQIKDAIAVSNFFFLMHALNLLWLKRKIRDCSQPICYVWLSDMEQL